MGFFRRTTTNVCNAGTGAVMCWLTGKWLGGFAMGILLATYFAGRCWLWVGWISLALACIVAIPVMRAAFCRRQTPEGDQS